MYYYVKAKCGDVGRGKYVIKTFSIVANSRSEAAQIGKIIPRVKNQLKNCIVSVDEVSYKEYMIQEKRNKLDPYLNAKCHKDVNINKEEIYTITMKRKYKKSLEFEPKKID